MSAKSPRSPTVTRASPSQRAIDSQFAGQRGGDVGRRLARLDERADDVQCVAATVGLQVDAADQPAVEQERPHVVAELRASGAGV